MKTFRQLYDGEIDGLLIGIDLGATTAKRDQPAVGIWRLDRQQLLVIAQSILISRKATEDEIIRYLDEWGPENRVFRLNAAVAAWLDDNDPVAPLDYVIV